MLSRINLALFSFILLSLCSSILYATEPQNLQITKDILGKYHDSGAYEQDLDEVGYQAQAYLAEVIAEQQKQKSKGKLAVVFDIDETVLSNYAYMQKLNFGGTSNEIVNLIEEGKSPAIPVTLALYQQAGKAQIYVFFITGRKDTAGVRKNTADNLHAAGFDKYESLILKPVNYKPTVSTYKTAARKKITDQGYHIVLNIGDQMSDLNGGYADRTYKLPNPYYYIP